MKKESINELGNKTVSALTANALLEKEQKTQISFSIRLEEKMYFVLVENIAFIFLKDETAYLLDFKGDKHSVFKTLDEIENAVSAQQFYRINRKMIVNRKAIKEIENYAHQRRLVHLILPTPENAIVSRLKVKSFLNWIEKG